MLISNLENLSTDKKGQGIHQTLIHVIKIIEIYSHPWCSNEYTAESNQVIRLQEICDIILNFPMPCLDWKGGHLKLQLS